MLTKTIVIGGGGGGGKSQILDFLNVIWPMTNMLIGKLALVRGSTKKISEVFVVNKSLC